MNSSFFKPAARRRRGVTMLGVAALIVILGTFCAIVLDRSLESYAAASELEARLQARAAAEGMAVLLAQRDAPTSATLGNARVTRVAQPTDAGAAAKGGTLLQIEIHKPGSPAAQFQFRFIVRRIATGGPWIVEDP